MIQKDLSSEKIQENRARLEKHFNKRTADEALLQRAWQTAQKLAAMLYEEFGATQVAVFGSLAQQNRFSKWSDIDMAVWGLSFDQYLRAVYETIGFSQEFNIDLVSFEDCKGMFRDRIQNQVIPIQKGEAGFYRKCHKIEKRKVSYTLHKELIQRMNDGYTKVKGAVQLIDQALQNIQDAPERYRRSIEIEIARYLYDFYKQLENIFARIAQEFDQSLPAGEEWHKTLLQQIAEPTSIRAPVISQDTYIKLQKLLGFRHVFLYIYGDELDYAKMLENATRVNDFFPMLSKELEAFIAFLKKQEND